MKLGTQLFRSMFRLVKLFFVSVLCIASITPSGVFAQSTDDPWTDPLNLSHSGVAENPSVVVDSEGGVHAIWQDDLGKYIYTGFDGSEWSAPKTTDWDLVFSWIPPLENVTPVSIYNGPNPLFIAGPREYIFAFWVTPTGGLFTSKVENQDIRDKSWEYARLIMSGVGSYAATVDASGDWHLAYFRRVPDLTNPAGIYYTRSKSGGRSWTAPVLLYQSTYVRRLDEGEGNLSVATASVEDALHVYVAWDNRPRKQVFLAQSADGGESWEQPTLVAGPVSDSELSAPFNIHVGANQNSIMLVWQSGRPEGPCSQIYQFSKDSGVSWSNPEPMLTEMLSCAQSTEFVTELPNSPEGSLYFLAETKNQVFLAAWNGIQWSQPQAQPVLSRFEEPEIFTDVIFGCHGTAILGDRLYVIGCDEGGGGDVWLTSRDIGPNISWADSDLWSQPSPVTNDDLEIEAIELLATDDGLIHGFFSQQQDPVIYYTYWDGELWSRITQVLQLPEGEAVWPTIAEGTGNELFLVGRTDGGTLYFSRATSGNAATESLWSPPTRLETNQNGEIGSVDVARDAAGTVYVAYSVPVNDQRGIYLVMSKDQGATWSTPQQVFDGAVAGFDFVGAPSLLTSGNGLLHIIWKVQSIQGEGAPEPLSLFYTRSQDGGRTFNDAEIVVEETVGWREMVFDGNGNLHLLWQPHDNPTTVWDQLSLDIGQTWEHPLGLPDERKYATVMSDPVGRLHLVSAGSTGLGHWLWDGGRWESEAPSAWSLVTS